MSGPTCFETFLILFNLIHSPQFLFTAFVLVWNVPYTIYSQWSLRYFILYWVPVIFRSFLKRSHLSVYVYCIFKMSLQYCCRFFWTGSVFSSYISLHFSLKIVVLLLFCSLLLLCAQIRQPLLYLPLWLVVWYDDDNDGM